LYRKGKYRILKQTKLILRNVINDNVFSSKKQELFKTV